MVGATACFSLIRCPILFVSFKIFSVQMDAQDAYVETNGHTSLSVSDLDVKSETQSEKHVSTTYPNSVTNCLAYV